MEYAHSINDAMELAAAKSGLEGWKAYKWEKVHGGDLVTGCVPDGTYAKGPKKGRPRFCRPVAGTRLTVVVTGAELDLHAADYERDEHKCWRCKGSGEEFAGWSRDTGVRRQTCSACKGSGMPPNNQVERQP
jgi:hypothetical protein